MTTHLNGDKACVTEIMGKCGKCGTPLRRNAKFCHHCGTKAAQGGRRRKIWLILTALVLGLATAILAVRRERPKDLYDEFPEVLDQRYYLGFFPDAPNPNTLAGAAYANNVARIPERIAAGDKVNAATTTNLWTPLHWAAFRGNAEATQELLRRGADVHTVDDRKLTALHLAACSGSAPTVKALIAYKADVNRRDDFGGTPLHYASIYGSIEVADVLLQYGAKPDARDRNGASPLQTAAVGDRTEVIELLARRGANLYQRNSRGETPLQVAQRHRNKRAIELLRRLASTK